MWTMMLCILLNVKYRIPFPTTFKGVMKITFLPYCLYNIYKRRHTRKDVIIYVDMDDVMCDFLGAFHKEKHTENKFPQSRHGFFKELTPLDKAIESYKKLEKIYDVRILTAPSVRNPMCYTEKRLWVEEHLGMDACDKMNICPDKSKLRGEFLIDDSITKGQLEFEGKLLRFGKEYKDWDSIISYFDNLSMLEILWIKIKKIFK